MGVSRCQSLQPYFWQSVTSIRLGGGYLKLVMRSWPLRIDSDGPNLVINRQDTNGDCSTVTVGESAAVVLGLTPVVKPRTWLWPNLIRWAFHFDVEEAEAFQQMVRLICVNGRCRTAAGGYRRRGKLDGRIRTWREGR